MIVNQGNVANVFQGLRATFVDALKTMEAAEIQRLMASAPSSTREEVYPVGALLGDLEEVIDVVTMTNIGNWVQRVPNKTFARGVEVRRDDIADDNIGVYRPAVQQLAKRAALYPLRLAVEVLLAGFTTPWVDGANVFSAGHTWVGGLAWSNLQANVLNPTNFDAACLALETRQGPGGVALGLVPRVLICGPQRRAAAETILNVAQISGTDNRQYKRCDLMVLGRFGNSTAWFVADDQYGKPMVLQEREAAEFTELEDPRADGAFYREVFAYKARRRCAVAILAPWLIQASTG